MTAKQIHEATGKACRGLLRASLFLQSRTGQVYPERIGYALMLVPAAVVLAEDGLFSKRSVWSKLEYWYWTSLFGGTYQLKQNEACVADVTKLYRWCVEDEFANPFRKRREKVFARAGYSDEMSFLGEGVPGTLADGTMQFTLARRPRDLWEEGWSGVTLSAAGGRVETSVKTVHRDGRERKFPMILHQHHIVPLANVTKVGKTSGELRERKESLYNSALNKILISKCANERIGARAPEQYLKGMPPEVLAPYFIDMTGGEIWERISKDDPLRTRRRRREFARCW